MKSGMPAVLPKECLWQNPLSSTRNLTDEIEDASGSSEGMAMPEPA